MSNERTIQYMLFQLNLDKQICTREENPKFVKFEKKRKNI